MGFEGFIDHAGGGIVRGWARDMATDQPVTVDLIVGGQRLASGVADLFRKDLADLGKGKGYHAFVHVIPQEKLREHDGAVRVVFGGTDQDLSGSPIIMPPRTRIGSLPQLVGASESRLQCGLVLMCSNVVHGWAYDPDRPEQRFTVRVVVDRHDGPPREIGRMIAEGSLVTLSDGRQVDCGFLVRIPIESYVADVTAYLEPDQIPLTAEPVHLGPEPRFEGCFDGIIDGAVAGWAWAAHLDYKPALDIAIDGKFCGIAFPVLHRGDLENAAIGDGNCAFSYGLPSDLLDGGLHNVAVTYRGTDIHLSGSPATLRLQCGEGTAKAFAGASIGSDAVLRGYIAAPDFGQINRAEIEIAEEGVTVAAIRPHQIASHGPFPEHYTVAEFELPIPPGSTGKLTATIAGGNEGFEVQAVKASAQPAKPGFGELSIAEAKALNAMADHTSGSKKVKFLVAIWGASYIERFCEVGVPSLLADNNLPYLVSVFEDFEFTFLTREEDIPVIRSHAAFDALDRQFKTKFVLIDDIIDKYFKRSSGIYAVALSYAFLKGIADSGEDATRTNFVFWNADFMASDGTLKTLTASILAGNVCTMAPSLRMNADVLGQIMRRRDNKTSKLSLSSQELVAMGLKNPHPTVTAKTLNEDVSTTISNINQFYWRLDENILLARSFLMFMLHIRPEQVPEDIYSFCDYAFVPDMVVHGNVEYICRSDEAFIAELQEPEKESEFIVSGTPNIGSFAEIIDDTATLEHYSASQYLLVFNAGPPITIDDATATEGARQLARTMSAVYDRLRRRRPWHAHHFHWRGSMRVLNADAAPGYEQGPYPYDYPRGETARLTRWTGYDLDYLPESWDAPSEALDELYDSPPRLLASPVGSMRTWLTSVFDGYRDHWNSRAAFTEEGDVSLVHPDFSVEGWEMCYRFHFQGTHWGLVEQHGGEWLRLLGPDRMSSLLLRIRPGRALKLSLFGRLFDDAHIGELSVLIDGAAPGGRLDQCFGDRFQIQIFVSAEAIARLGGKIEVTLFDTVEGRHGFGFSRLRTLSSVVEKPEGCGDPQRWSVEPPTPQALAGLKANARPSMALSFDGSEALIGAGWKPASAGSSYRWIEGGEELVTYLSPEPYRVRYYFAAALTDPALLQRASLRLSTDDTIALIALAEDDNFVLECEIPASLIDRNAGWLALALNFGGGRGGSHLAGHRLPLVRIALDPLDIPAVSIPEVAR